MRVLEVFGPAVARIDGALEALELWADRAAADVIAEELYAARVAIGEGLSAVAVALNERKK